LAVFSSAYYTWRLQFCWEAWDMATPPGIVGDMDFTLGQMADTLTQEHTVGMKLPPVTQKARR
jgi:hypothetical protein